MCLLKFFTGNLYKTRGKFFNVLLSNRQYCYCVMASEIKKEIGKFF